MMEDKRDIDHQKHEEGPHNKANMRRVQPAGITFDISSHYSLAESHNRTHRGVIDSSSQPEEDIEGDHNILAVHHQILQIKEEENSSPEDTDSVEGEGDLRNVETIIIQNCHLTQDVQGHCTPKYSVRRSEISEDLRKKVVEAHKNGMGYKNISKELGLCKSTVRYIICKWKKFSTVATLPRSGRPTKISAKARRTIVKRITKKQRGAAKNPKASPALDYIYGCETSSKTELLHSPFSMMEGKSDSNRHVCKESPHNKAHMRGVQPVGETSDISSQSSIVEQHSQIQRGVCDSTSEPEELSEGDHYNLAAHHQTLQVKAEEDDSPPEEEDTDSVEVEGDLTNDETNIIQDSHLTQNAQGSHLSKFSVGRSKEISEDLREKVVEAHKSGKGYKSISKELGLHRSTVRQIIYKWKKFSTVATLPRSGRPTKISAKARHTILKQMTKNPRATSKDLQASLAVDNICVHQSTIRKTLSKWCSWDLTMEDITELQQDELLSTSGLIKTSDISQP